MILESIHGLFSLHYVGPNSPTSYLSRPSSLFGFWKLIYRARAANTKSRKLKNELYILLYQLYTPVYNNRIHDIQGQKLICGQNVKKTQG
uniref:Uncharacterized protein n=1 Tax=Solanum tuberosum TaxID=4113 RepID=M1D7U4_SOLTU